MWKTEKWRDWFKAFFRAKLRRQHKFFSLHLPVPASGSCQKNEVKHCCRSHQVQVVWQKKLSSLDFPIQAFLQCLRACMLSYHTAIKRHSFQCFGTEWFYTQHFGFMEYICSHKPCFQLAALFCCCFTQVQLVSHKEAPPREGFGPRGYFEGTDPSGEVQLQCSPSLS